MTTLLIIYGIIAVIVAIGFVLLMQHCTGGISVKDVINGITLGAAWVFIGAFALIGSILVWATVQLMYRINKILDWEIYGKKKI